MDAAFKSPLFKQEIAGIELQKNIAFAHRGTFLRVKVTNSAAHFGNDSNGIAFGPDNTASVNGNVDWGDIGPARRSQNERRQGVESF